MSAVRVTEGSPLTNAPRPLQIPERHADALEALAAIDDGQFAQLVGLLGETADRIDRSATAAAVAEIGTLDAGNARSLVDSLDQLAALVYASSSAAHGVIDRVLATPPFDTMDADAQEILGARLDACLQCDDVRLAGKAIDVGFVRERRLQYAELHTDLRPIFLEDAEGLHAKSGVVTHTLKINHTTSGPDWGSFFIVLQDEDLVLLRTLIDRAERKSEALRGQLTDAGFRLWYGETG